MQAPEVRAWQEAEAAVARHAAGEGAIAVEAEAAALDDLARMASLAALSGVDLPSIDGVADFVHGVPRVAAVERPRAGPVPLGLLLGRCLRPNGIVQCWGLGCRRGTRELWSVGARARERKPAL